MYVKFNDLNAQWNCVKKPVKKRLKKLFESSQYINGPDVKTFEENFAQEIGSKYCIGTSNGTDSITLCIKALQKYLNITNCLILIPANTFCATYLGAKGVIPKSDILLVDCDEYYQIDISDLTNKLQKYRSSYDHCIIIGVHLYGHCCDVQNIEKLCAKYNCSFVEDSAQSHGTMTTDRYCGTIGILSAFSFYPGKNLGACGDAGCITTNNEDLYKIINSLKNFGAKPNNKYEYLYEGYNHRLDTIQAIILDEKLKFLNEWNESRINIAKIYDKQLRQDFIIPQIALYCKKHTYHLYVIQVENREKLIKHLSEHNIETGIHYPIPIELAFDNFQYVERNNNTIQLSQKILSLPIHPFMTENQTIYVCDTIRRFYFQ